MTTELWLLLCSLPVFALYIAAQSLLYRWQHGVMYAATARDEARPEGVLLGRAERALHNFQETWPVYIILILIGHLATPGDAAIFWGAVVWLGARVVYLPLYLGGVFGLRSAVWMVGLLGLVAMFIGVLF